MIKDIVKALISNDWFINDEDIDIAKGKYALPKTFKEARKQRKRNGS